MTRLNSGEPSYRVRRLLSRDRLYAVDSAASHSRLSLRRKKRRSTQPWLFLTGLHDQQDPPPLSEQYPVNPVTCLQTKPVHIQLHARL